MNILHTPHHEVFAQLTGVTSYLEIGVQEGQSLAAVVRANPGLQRVTLCDDWGSSHGGTGRGDNGHIEILLRHLGFVGKVTYLTGRSQELVPSLNDAFDLVHVDGDHSTEGARSDLENILRVSTHSSTTSSSLRSGRLSAHGSSSIGRSLRKRQSAPLIMALSSSTGKYVHCNAAQAVIE
jgi:hypothetical protein